MKKCLLFIVLNCIVFSASAQYTLIPDANFEAALSSLDNTPGDGKILTSSIQGLTTLNVANKNISSLSGIEDFVSLTQLTANGNSLTSIDVSNLVDLEVLTLFENQLTAIDLTANTKLTEIDFFGNQLSSIDLSENDVLENAYLDSNLLTSVDISLNTVLERLDVSNNDLSSLTIKNGNNTNFRGFSATGNANLTCIIVDDISYAESNFTNIDSGVRFINTSCDYIPIPDANFEAALSAYDDVASDGQVPIADIESLLTLDVSNSSISSLSGIEYFTSLTQLIANSNSLTAIDVSALVNLEELELAENQIDTIDLSKNPKLRIIDFFGNLLTSLDLSQNTLLRRVFVDGNAITEIDLSLSTKLERLDVSNNSLTSLNIKNGNNTSIRDFGATGNSSLSCILVDNVAYAQTNFTNIDTGVVFNTVNCDYTAIPDINFEAALEALGYDDFSGDGQVPSYLISGVTSLSVFNNNISDATGIEAFTALEELNIYSNSLTSLDVSNNSQLKHLRCQNNQIAALDVSSNTLLETLICDNNPFTSLDLSKNILLNDINISSTFIRTIDVSKNTVLTVLTAENLGLLSIDLGSNPLLEEVSLIDGAFVIINLKSTGNTAVVDMDLSGNTNLTCVSVDDASYATTNWTDIDDASVYTTSACSLTYTSIPDTAFETRLFDLGYDNINGDGQAPTAFIQSVTNLDLSGSTISDITGIKDFTSLEILTVSSNQIQTLDLSGNTVIKEIYAESTNIETVNVSNMTALEILHCNSANDLSTLTLTGATSLKELSIFNITNLTSVDVSTNTALEKITSYGSSLANLNTTGAVSLKELQLYTSKISSLDLSTNTALEIVNANSAPLTSINTNGATALEELYVYQTQITALDVSTNTALTTLHCYNVGGLTSLNVSGATALTDLQCQNTGITSLDVSTNINLETLYCQDNALTDLNLRNGNNTLLTDFNLTNNSVSVCTLVDNVIYANTNFTNIDSNVTFTVTDCGYTQIPDPAFEAALAFIDDIAEDGQVPSARASGLTGLNFRSSVISDFTGLEDFVSITSFRYSIASNLTSIDFSGNPELTSISISNNSNLTTVNVTQNPLLETLDLWRNNISEIDLTQNPLLQEIFLDENGNLSTIDLSQNTALINVFLSSCSLTAIDLSNNHLLEQVYIEENNLTSIDVTNNPLLKELYIYDNPIEGYLDLSSNTSLIDLGAYNCNLTAVNLKNGNNSNFTYIDTTGNSNLTCVQVDDAVDATSKINDVYYIDNQTSFNEDCGYNFAVALEVILEGAFELGVNNIIMHDNLRDNTTVLIPTTSPYNSNETCETTVFDTTGENAVVDWVEVQLRNATDITEIVDTKSALLLRNGTVVDTDGTSPVPFSQLQGDFYVGIAHRNHLTIVSNTIYSFTSTIDTIDFTNASNISGGTSALIDLGDGYNGIPLGDIDENGQVQNADISNTVLQIGVSGYNIFDVDMNGQVQNADVNTILQNIGKGEQF
ncbi:hypothetical protein [Tenacibaculum agarivorans]|uniref:hypothetical protein n=1 Tax=Tenacibaculum agarivorans TaxID=1908389 RepID=UPI00094B8BF7|nr:hypothetical protein [Tenacibaculum agarivorans]